MALLLWHIMKCNNAYFVYYPACQNEIETEVEWYCDMVISS
jgi:hypothetical protein